MTTPLPVDELIQGAINDEEEVGFSDLFDDNLLRHHSFQSDMDAFTQSRDFSMTETGLGEEDAFGVFECEPSNNNNNNSMVGSIENHESFAGCNSITTSPSGRTKKCGSTNELDSGAGSATVLLHSDLNSDIKPPISEVYVDFSNTGHNTNSLDTSSLYSSEAHDVQRVHNHANGGERYSSPRCTISDTMSRDTSNIQDHRHPPSRFSSHSSSTDNHPYSSATPESQTIGGTVAVDDMFQQYTIEQLEPEPLIHSDHQQHHMHQNHMLQQQPYPSQVQYPSQNQVSQQHVPLQQQQPHSLMQNNGMQRMPNVQNMQQNQQYHQQPHSSTFQQTPSTTGTMMIDNTSNSFRVRQQNHSSHGSINYQGNSQTMMNHSSQGVPIPPNSLRMSRNSFHGHQPLSNQSYHSVSFHQSDGTMMNNSFHGPTSTPAAIGASFHSDEYQRRGSTSFKDLSNTVGHTGMQMNVAIQPEQHSPQKFFNSSGGYESPSTMQLKTSIPSTNINDVMEKLSVSMRRSAMSRSMVKHISGRSLVSQSSARGLLASQGSSRGLGQSPIAHHLSNRNIMKQGSERSFGMEGRPVPIRRLSTNAKHHPPGQSLHRNSSHRGLNHSSHGQISLQIDDRNVGTF